MPREPSNSSATSLICVSITRRTHKNLRLSIMLATKLITKTGTLIDCTNTANGGLLLPYQVSILHSSTRKSRVAATSISKITIFFFKLSNLERLRQRLSLSSLRGINQKSNINAVTVDVQFMDWSSLSLWTEVWPDAYVYPYLKFVQLVTSQLPNQPI